MNLNLQKSNYEYTTKNFLKKMNDSVDQIFSNLFFKFSLKICSKNFQQSFLKSSKFKVVYS